jgi:hypothetical protein
MNKHTPGPWHWDSDPVKGDPLNRVRFQVVAMGRTIAKTYYSSGDMHAQPDTVLMAAAPDLLQALQGMLDAHAGKAPLGTALNKAEAAINLATRKAGASDKGESK